MRNVIVTGGSRGIGLGISESLAKCGYHVIAISRNDSAMLHAAQARAKSDGSGKISSVIQDLMNISELQDAARNLRKEFGSIYGLVNNAGLGTSGVLGTMSESDILRLVQLNVTSPILFTKHLIRSMLATGSGRIVNISSIVGITGYSGLSVYSATKSAIIGFTKSLARELGAIGVTVNAVLPGFIETEMTKEMDLRSKAKVVNRAALKRLTTVEDISNIVSYLMSDGASGITGTTITVDAGTTA